MELHQLRYALAVARMGNFSRAAAHCHVSQPSLSQQIQKLEAELGDRLFTRLKREAVPTAAGRALLIRAARIIGDVEAAQHDVADAGGEVRGVVALGVLPTIAPYLLPRVLTLCRQRYPRLDVVIHETTTAQLLIMAAACEIDFAVLSGTIPDDRFQREDLFSEDLLLAVPADHPLAGRRSVRLEDVETERFILLQEGHCLGDQALRFCDQQKCHPQVIFRTAQLETIQALVAASVGVSLIPRMACQPGLPHRPAYVVIAPPRPTRTVAVLRRREQYLSRGASALLDALRQTAKPKP
ncbi:MAG: LysR family transcriptional regulator [Verrucomicrobiales bacterium]